jgi:hypothetical protein
VEYFEGVVKQDMNVSQQPETLQEYVEGWRRKIRDHGFGPYFKGANYFKKGDSFMNHEGSNLIVRRVLFRYDCSSLQFKDITCLPIL